MLIIAPGRPPTDAALTTSMLWAFVFRCVYTCAHGDLRIPEHNTPNSVRLRGSAGVAR